MAYPADAFSGGVQGCWFDAQVITNFKRDTVALADYNGTDGRFFDEWIDKSGNGNNLTSSLPDWDGKAYDVSGFKYAWFWHDFVANQGGSTTGFYMAIALDAGPHVNPDFGLGYYTTIWTDVNGANTGFRLEYNGDGLGLPNNSAYNFSAGNGSTRINCIFSSGDPLYSFENGKKLIEVWWTAALGLNARINKGAVTTVACGSVSAGTSQIHLPAGNNWIGFVHNYLHTKNFVPDSTGRNAIADSFGALAGITLASSGFPNITGSVHARELPIDDKTLSLGGNARSGLARISESGSDTFRARQALFVGGRQGSAAISESGGSDRFSAVRQVADVSDAAFITWLESDSKIVTLLVEADVNVLASPGGGETTRYMSNTGYTTVAADTPASTHYQAIVSGGGVISEVMPVDGSASMAFGDIEITNMDGTLDSWMDDIWTGRRCRIFIGDQRWARASFRTIFDGITNENLMSRARNVLNLTVRDKLQKLNTSVTENKLGGTSLNADRVLPLTFGECFNVSPLLVDKSILKFQVHHSTGAWNSAERIIEVRDNGIPVPFTANLSEGTFTLQFSPAGAVTASVQGDGVPYSSTSSRLIQRLVKNGSTTPLVDADLDAFNLAVFDSGNLQAIGLFLADTSNVLSVCQDIASSVGGQLVMTATGLLRLVKIQLPAILTPSSVTVAKIIEGTLEVASRPPVIAAVKIGYCRNWTPQPNLQTAIPTEHKDLYAKEWLSSTAKDDSVAFNYKLSKETEQIPTLLLTKADADAEALRRLNLWKVQRTVFRYQGTAELLVEQLGGYQTITNRRFGLVAGKTGQIVGIQRDWMNGRVVIELLV